MVKVACGLAQLYLEQAYITSKECLQMNLHHLNEFS